MKERTGKWLALFPLLMFVAAISVTMFSKVTAAAAGKTEKPAFERQVAAELLGKKQFTVSDKTIKMKEDDTAGGVKISGTAESLKNAVFQYGGSFDFGQESADYLVIDALAERKKKIQLAFYLDDSAEPFTTVTLAKQKKKEVWSTVKNRCVSLADAKITGSHKVSFRVIPAAGEIDKLKLVFRSVTFMKNDIPMLDFSIDESMGSIDAMNADNQHDTECYGDMTLRIPKGYQSEYSKEKFETQTYTLDYIRGRGNSTWMSGKKPYKLKLDTKQDLLGMGANKHWILLANYYDITMLRNKFTYWLGGQLGMEFTPQCAFVDVVMNGEYLGSYYLCEQIRVGKSRVDIDDLEETPETMESTDPAIISGGYLLGMSPYGDESSVCFTTERDSSFVVESPSFEDYKNEAQIEYIKNYMQQTENAIYGEDYRDKDGKSYTEYMDVASAVDYYWIQEISMNGDAFGSPSTYLYKKRNGKLYWGPLWDFDYVAWGATEYNENQVEGFSQNRSTWFGRLLKDPEFCRQVKERWPAIKEKLLAAAEDGGQIDQYSEQQYESQKHNYEIWEAYSEQGWWGYKWDVNDVADPIEKKEISYDSEVKRFKSWIQERVAWIDANLDDIQGKYYSVKFLVDDVEYATIYAEENEGLPGFPTEPVKEGYTFDGWYATVEDGEGYEYEVTQSSAINQDLVVKAKWTKGSNRAEIREIAFLSEEYYVLCEEEFSIPYCSLPFNAKNNVITWVSDNEDVVSVSDGGLIHTKVSGEATITAAANGVTASCKVHVIDYRDFDFNNMEKRLAQIKLTAQTETLEKGKYKRLPLTVTPDDALFFGSSDALFASSDDSIVKVNECGYISGEKAGTAVVVLYNTRNSKMQCCTVTVTDSAQKEPDKPTPNDPQKTDLKKGMKFTHRGLQYQVISVQNGKCELSCIGIKNKKCKKAEIPAAITYQKQKCTVTTVAKKCFAKCKKLKEVTLGKNVKKVNSGAFRGCKKLKKVYVQNSKLKKSLKKVLKKDAKKAKIYTAK